MTDESGIILTVGSKSLGPTLTENEIVTKLVQGVFFSPDQLTYSLDFSKEITVTEPFHRSSHLDFPILLKLVLTGNTDQNRSSVEVAMCWISTDIENMKFSTTSQILKSRRKEIIGIQNLSLTGECQNAVWGSFDPNDIIKLCTQKVSTLLGEITAKHRGRTKLLSEIQTLAATIDNYRKASEEDKQALLLTLTKHLKVIDRASLRNLSLSSEDELKTKLIQSLTENVLEIIFCLHKNEMYLLPVNIETQY